jgi:hypothetical protein
LDARQEVLIGGFTSLPGVAPGFTNYRVIDAVQGLAL